MAETPRSERSQTRFSTPVSDLDDHRHQQESLPRANGQGSRRGTLASIADRPDIAALAAAQLELGHGMIARDFENAVVDDEDDHSIRSVHETPKWRRNSISPNVGRRGTVRLPPPAIEAKSRSRESSSSRSTSPPNSVDAFANPQRRRRGDTITSDVPPFTNLNLTRTISGASHHRRPTFDDAKSTHTAQSRHSSVQDDVCFPAERDQSKTYLIDFEELEEFVAESHEKTPVSHPFQPPFGKQKPSEPKVFHDLRTCKTNASDSDVVDDKQVVDHEKKPDLPEHELERVASHTEYFNRFTFFSSEIDETIHAPELGGLLMPGESFRDLFELGPDGGVWWLDMLNPSEEEVTAICKAFGVHPLTREDITTQETREKVELFRSYYFVCFRSFYQEDKESEDFMEPINVYTVVFREGLLTFTFCNNPHAANVRKRIGRLRDYVNLSADWICYALIDDIVDAFGPVLRDVEHEADAIEDNVFTARFEDSRAILRQIGTCRKKVMSLLRLLGGKADVIKGFAKRCNEQYSMAPRGDVGLYLSDVQDHVVTMMSNLSHFEKILSRSHSNYLAQISVDNIAQGNKANSLLSRVTVLATILVPLNLVTGLFGMNVRVPGMDGNNLAWWFGILGFMLIFIAACLLTAWKIGLLEDVVPEREEEL
ncbi:cora-domain-containing protein [Aureobasidium pullulans]|uniref:Cora-domain-containing protein n=1 Tax=Aureobasidium pullulans TaxID=5580 RepID=A0A4S9JXJ5_AURPU|nr:cora-domain-containing protein [Aureobasidium pullulans]THX78666.1 cora-domain-containing protein [Aureobasidium pullulans]THY07205.1 cora-domain-containing protein [Aureobasidium pullulans]THY39374.1 cora-domain-containing protein [Aureobasidium pullulans]THY77188.1 cora-domain-containing protein [Aureobasidium pullulans]